jgi:hypothetical protein
MNDMELLKLLDNLELNIFSASEIKGLDVPNPGILKNR